MENREKLSKAFFEIEDLTFDVDKLLQGAEDHPAEITKEDAIKVRAFLKEMETIVAENFELFVSMSDA